MIFLCADSGARALIGLLNLGEAAMICWEDVFLDSSTPLAAPLTSVCEASKRNHLPQAFTSVLSLSPSSKLEA